MTALTVVTFVGPARVDAGSGPLAVRIRGRERLARGSRALEVAFSGTTAGSAPPEAVRDAQIECAGAGVWRIRSGTSEWLVTARSVHVHADPEGVLGAVLPPHRVPLRKRAFWAVVMALMRRPAGRRLLLRLRG